MFSIILFIFVGIVLVGGFIAVTWRRKNKVPLENDESAQTNKRDSSRPSNSAFNEPSISNMKGQIMPTDNKLSQNDFDDESEVTK
jgi:hypothetical protein